MRTFPHRVRRHGGWLGASQAIWLIKGPKHSTCDVVTVFRGVAMTGDLELGTLESVNAEVPLRTKRKSMDWLGGFPDRSGYHVHSIVSAHLNDVRVSIRWRDLFRYMSERTGPYADAFGLNR